MNTNFKLTSIDDINMIIEESIEEGSRLDTASLDENVVAVFEIINNKLNVVDDSNELKELLENYVHELEEMPETNTQCPYENYDNENAWRGGSLKKGGKVKYERR